MNERIQELYNQSGGLVRMYEGKLTYFPAYQKNVGNGDFEFSSFDPEKFAELIVKECADVLKKDMELAHIQLIPLDFSMYANGRLQRTIKQHFGVEE